MSLLRAGSASVRTSWSGGVLEGWCREMSVEVMAAGEERRRR